MKKRKILITGISGSGGSFLADYLIDNVENIEIYGLSRWHSTSNNQNISKIINKIKIIESDMNDFASVYNAIKISKPDIVFHLAAHANVRASFDTPGVVFSNNTVSTINLLESIRLNNIDPIIQICSTSEVYGLVKKNEIPIDENCPYRPASPYAVSKLASDMLGYSYFKNYKMKIIRTRMFTYVNPRRTDLFATSFAMQIAKIENNLQKELKHGNLNSIRTILDIKDAMRAYWLSIDRCKYGEAYNIGGNYVISVKDFLKKLKSFSKVKIVSKLDNKLLRPTDVTLQIPNANKFKKITKWKPKAKIDDTILDLLNYWRERINPKNGSL